MRSQPGGFRVLTSVEAFLSVKAGLKTFKARARISKAPGKHLESERASGKRQARSLASSLAKRSARPQLRKRPDKNEETIMKIVWGRSQVDQNNEKMMKK